MMGETPADADAWEDVPNKFEDYFSPEAHKEPTEA
ncbi:DUF3470 domain-containing protein [Aurantimonas marina]